MKTHPARYYRYSSGGHLYNEVFARQEPARAHGEKNCGKEESIETCKEGRKAGILEEHLMQLSQLPL